MPLLWTIKRTTVMRKEQEGQHWGYIVINQQYMEAEEREVFLPDYEEENNP